jgi:hypothetical protein
MNPIKEIFDNIADDELKEIIREIKEDSDLGIIRANGGIRKYANKVVEITGNSVATELFQTELNLVRQAAFRFSK